MMSINYKKWVLAASVIWMGSIAGPISSVSNADKASPAPSGPVTHQPESPPVSVASIGMSGFGFSQPAQRLKETVDRVLEIITDERLSLDLGSQRKALFLEIGKRFNYRQMAESSLGNYWKGLSRKDRDRFVGLFKKLLEKSYVHLIEDYKSGTVHYLGEKVNGKFASIKTQVLSQGKSISVNYKLVRHDNDWRIYDFVVEGVSLVRKYRSQFSRVIRKNSIQGLYILLKDQTL